MERLGVWSVLAISWVLGLVMSQTTLGPAVTISTAAVNLSTILPSTTGPTCSVLNTSTCAACAPGSYYDNGIDPAMLMLSRCWPVCVSGSLSALSARVLSASGWTTNLPSLLLWILQQVRREGTVLDLTLKQNGCMANTGFFAVFVVVSFTGSPVCQACPTGAYSNNSGSVSCRPCTPGFYTSSQNSTSCNPCPQGTFCNASSCSQCRVCPAGSEALRTAAKECTPCRPGMHKPSLQSMCQICSSGFYQIRWGQENCDICPENHYCPSPDVTPIQCPVDAFCPEGSLAPSYCMETFFRKAGETCELAPVTIALLVIGGGVGLLFIIVLVLRRKRDNDSELSMSRTPLLRKDRPPNRFYGIGCDAEPVYAGW
ncbi:hypothetical protein DNTS_014411 [Danionella cerebrum]|uniref:TNFR-Cys domain-containing protein n=1 Tax=Danionella cerebrum TaxID=2873325 RepID=A0A553MXN2_9TELE|nr:hypothetical protein DNTS_014411 [Danionella translucida]